MDVLNGYSRTIEGALGTTVVKAVVDTRRQLIAYTSAGRLPPVLNSAAGTVDLLGTRPPILAVPFDQSPRPQATVPYTPGDTLVLYADGLVERREDIDIGLPPPHRRPRLPYPAQPREPGDTLLTLLGVADGGRDDIASIAVIDGCVRQPPSCISSC